MRAMTSGSRSTVRCVVTVRPRPTRVASGRRPTNEYRPQRSPPSTDSRRKPGRSPTTWRKAPTGVRVSATMSRQTGTIRCRRDSERNLSRPGRQRSEVTEIVTRRCPGRRPGRSSCARRCGRRPRRPGPPSREGCRRRSRNAPRAPTAGRPTSPPCTSTPGGCGSRTRCGRSSSVRRKASWSM